MRIYNKLAILGILLVFSSHLFGQAKLPASPIRTVYITPTSHYDFGFVEPPDAIRERAARHIDEVIRVAESDPEFRWTIESVWQVNEWLKRAKKPTSVLPNDKQKIAAADEPYKVRPCCLVNVLGQHAHGFHGRGGAQPPLLRLYAAGTNLRRPFRPRYDGRCARPPDLRAVRARRQQHKISRHRCEHLHRRGHFARPRQGPVLLGIARRRQSSDLGQPKRAAATPRR